MRWAKTVEYRTSIFYDGQIYNIRCLAEFDEFAVSINGEYICYLPKLPTRKEVIGLIEEEHRLYELTKTPYLIGGV